VPPPVATATPISTFCGQATPHVLCLSNRFRVGIVWQRPSTETGSGVAVSLISDTGTFWFFSPTNYEVMVKTLNGCAINQKWWVFAGGLTNVKVDLTVTDTMTGTSKTYSNAQGVPFQPVQDTAAFPCQ
jgi:hypothetical protein